MSFIEGHDVAVAACLKLVDLRPSVDPLTGAASNVAVSPGLSSADEAALEWALRCGETWGVGVVAVSAGGPECEAVLRDALAAGATEAVRVDVDSRADSKTVAAALASGFAAVDAEVVVFCGDASLDRGSGSVPAFLAHSFGAAQALGVVAIEIGNKAEDGLRLERRLDRGRRELLQVAAPAVVSIEGGTARLRRASLPRELWAPKLDVRVVRGPAPVTGDVELVGVAPYKPRPRVVTPPAGTAARDRILALTGVGHERTPARIVRLDPAAAADELLAVLTEWSEMPGLLVEGGR